MRAMEVPLPSEVLGEIEELVALGEFPDAAAAVVELVRQALSYRYRRSPYPGHVPGEPPAPSAPPGVPGDVNWIR